MPVAIKFVEAAFALPKTPADGQSLEEQINMFANALQMQGATIQSIDVYMIPSGKYGVNKTYTASLTFSTP